MPPRGYAGIDLAWGPRNPSGVAVLDAEGVLVSSCTASTDDDIVAAVGVLAGPRPVVAAIDAPLVVSNQTGARPCERAVTSAFGRFHAGAYPANRGMRWFSDGPRGERLAHRLRWTIDPTRGRDRAVAIEVYPHPAMVAFLGLDRVVPYKRRHRPLSARRTAFAGLLDMIEGECDRVLRLAEHPRWHHLRRVVAGATRPMHLNGVEDEVDAIWCAYLAWVWAQEPDRLMVYGDDADGFAAGHIVAPPPPVQNGGPDGRRR